MIAVASPVAAIEVGVVAVGGVAAEAAEPINVPAVTAALVAAIALIVLNGFYVAYEFAILAAKRSSFEEGPRRDGPVAAAARASLSDVSMQLAGAQLGITIASLALGRISEPALEVIIERLIGTSLSEGATHVVAIAVSLGVFTFLHLIFGEMVPKNIALAAPDATLRWLVIPYRFYLLLFRPVVRLLNGLANVASRAVGIEPRDELKSVHTTSELAAIVMHSSAGGAIDSDDAELLQGVLEFAERPVGEIATPLADYPSVELGATAGQMERMVAASGQERTLVLARGGAPTGYVHARDLLEVPASRRAGPIPTEYVRRLAVVPAERSAIEVLRQLRALKRQLAVVQAGGRPVGVVSLEEVVRTLIQPADPADGADVEAARSKADEPRDPVDRAPTTH